MRHDFLESPIEYLKGVGPQKADVLKKDLGIFTYGDMLHHFPFRYVDRTKFHNIRKLQPESPYIQLKGVIRSLVVKGEKRRKHLAGKFDDGTGIIDIKWFQGLKWLTASLQLNTEYILFGKLSEYNGQFNIIHPELEPVSEQKSETPLTMQPIYSTTEKLKLNGLDSKGILRLQKSLVASLPTTLPETLTSFITSEYKLPERTEALRQIHFPENQEKQRQAAFRIKFEELFFIQLRLLHAKQLRHEKTKGIVFPVVGKAFEDFYHHHLPFSLTNAQKKVLREIRTDCGSGRQMNRLLQGDVGSGKTLVALMTMLMALGNSHQACLMAPTEILATQHAETIRELLKNTDIQIGLLTGSTKAKARKELLQRLESGDLQILIGTHALIEDPVRFHKLGLAVIDEQHRFGVEQRARLWKKSAIVPHILVMTATPIPRTLAMTLYGDLDISVIDELPPGRKPIKTVHRYESHRLTVWKFIRDEIKLGRQVYIVYPMIEESEKMDLNNLMSGFEAVCRDFPPPEYQVSIVHGKMKAADKDFEMQRFLKKETHIMVATTVIEVGVNVPNASVMIIENAERFGLSQLHQLRGRVGRGADQSYCILMSSFKLSQEGRVRIQTMCETNDGFKIAETDLRLRGPGDAEGTQQSGMLDLKLADLSKDQQIVQLSREAAIQLLTDDPQIKSDNNRAVAGKLAEIIRRKGDWGKIS